VRRSSGKGTEHLRENAFMKRPSALGSRPEIRSGRGEVEYVG
jgi:hypothetical protein